jgi:hypothetical protein
VCVCAFPVLCEERIFIFREWEVVAVSFRLETCGCSVNQNSEFLRVMSCSVRFLSFLTAC